MTTLNSDSIDLFLNSIAMKGFSEQTVRAYKSDLTQLEEWAAVNDDLNDAAEKWLTSTRAQVSPKTTLRRISAVRAYGRWAGVGLLAGYRAPRAGRPRPHPLPEGPTGVMAMLDAAQEPHHAALIALCGLAALRVSEARSVRASDVSDDDRTVTVRGKGDRQRTIPLSDAAWSAVAPALAISREQNELLIPMSDRGARNYITTLGQKVLGHSVSSHDLRATLATAAHRQGASLRTVQEVLGHASPAQTQVYTDATMDEMRLAVEVTDG